MAIKKYWRGTRRIRIENHRSLIQLNNISVYMQSFTVLLQMKITPVLIGPLSCTLCRGLVYRQSIYCISVAKSLWLFMELDSWNKMHILHALNHQTIICYELKSIEQLCQLLYMMQMSVGQGLADFMVRGIFLIDVHTMLLTSMFDIDLMKRYPHIEHHASLALRNISRVLLIWLCTAMLKIWIASTLIWGAIVIIMTSL